MKTITISALKYTLIFCAFLLVSTAYSQVTLYSYDFEPSIEGWTIGGTDASRVNNSTWACAGSFILNSLGTDTAQNRLTSPVLDLTGNSSIDISFCHKADAVDNGEGFNLEYYDGTSWVLLNLYDKGDEFNTRGSTKPHNFTFNVDSATYTLSATSQFRFSSNCDDPAESNYFDDVLIEGYPLLPEINLQGNATNIVNGAASPNVGDDTEFGSVDITVGTQVNTFTIQNTDTGTLTIGAITFSGTNAADFSITSSPAASIAGIGNTTFDITFNPSALGLRTATVSIVNDDSDENPYTFDIQGTGRSNAQEISMEGNATDIADGDATPSPLDDTDFGSADVTSGNNPNTFTIGNSGLLNNLVLTGASPYVVISGTHAADFTLTANPTTPIVAGGSTTFTITFNPSALGLRTATISIANDDGDENPFNFDIQGTGVDACGGYVTSFPYSEGFETGLGLWQQDAGDNFDWTRQTGTTPSTSTGPPSASKGSYYLFTEATSNTSNTGNIESPCFDLTSASNPRFTFFYHMYGSNTGSLNVDLSTDNGTTYSVSLLAFSGEIQKNAASSWIPVSFDLSAYVGQTIKIRIQGITGSSDKSDIAIDNISVTDKTTPTLAPGGITTDLALWLKADDGLSYTDGQSVSLWEDQGVGSDVKPQVTGQEPTYRDNVNKNVNFNPVIEFDNSYGTFTLDGDYSHDDATTQFLTGDFGFYTQDIFMVMIPDDTSVDNSFGFFDIFCSDAHLDINSTDATGLGAGDFTGRVNNEILIYAHDSYTSSEGGDGYAVAEIGTGSSYDNIGIINARNNSANTQQELYYNANDIGNTQNDTAEYMNENDKRFWIGRSEGWKASLNARVAEVITYKTRLVDTDLTQERNRIQSYLAIKYGITLGTNGTSQDYVNSDGTVIWDINTGVPADDTFNYDIAGIGRDDVSELYQKQSRSSNNALDVSDNSRGQGVITIGINSIYDTNNLNSNTLTNKQFLVWGNNGVDLDNTAIVVEVDMSTSITPAISGGTNVHFNGIPRTWKVVENGGDIPAVEIAILENAVRTAAPPNGIYLMFISDTPNFDPTADYRIMTEDVNELGKAIVKTNYDFDGTKYITFGWAPEDVYVRSIYFDGIGDYVDMEDALDLNPTEFTISAWVNADTNSNDTSILSKRNSSYTEGYDFKITSTGKFQASWKTTSGSLQSITSSITIPKNEWHHLAIVYGSAKATLYIDGVFDLEINKTQPEDTDHSFYIGAAVKNIPEDFFHGNIDEVRVWDIALTIDQLHYIMNQEIEDNTNFVCGSYFISRSVTPTKDDIATIPWSRLAGYYPMTTYTYTNTKDESGNGNQGALRSLRTVDRQTAPLPYSSGNDGDWDTDATWSNGDVQTKPGANSIVDNTVTVDWNIVETNHNVTIDNTSLAVGNSGNRNVLALFVDSNKLTVEGDNTLDSGYGLTVSHYLNLDGKIDLDGESQLIQTIDSDLLVGATGSLERDQQGTKDLYTYNYWSSPVGFTTTANPNNYSYNLNNNTLRNGTDPNAPANITYVGGYDGSLSPFEISHYWVWKFSNLTSDDYSSWQHVRNTGTILAGEGYTMKGVDDTSGVVSLEQNYVFDGKPNNGDVSLTINLGNDYLVGNPYASAIDAEQFITDNGPIISGAGVDPAISGTLYFWEHWGGGSHILAEYQGGYGTYNYSGGAPAAAWGNPDPDVAQVGTGTKTPGRYIPVGQGFFVIGESTGTIDFNNGQRIFQKEGGSSIFMRSSGSTTARRDNLIIDNRMKLRIGFNSINTIHRQLLVTVDDRATSEFDWGFDALVNENQIDDMYWMITDEKYSVQGIDNIDENTILPLGIHTNDDGLNNITIDVLENVPSDLDIFAHDKELNIYHNLRESNYEIYLLEGEYLDRFEITFTNQSLSVDDVIFEDAIQVFYANTNESIIIQNPIAIEIESAEMFNMLGQSIYEFNEISLDNHVELRTQKLSAGTYIITLKTVDGTISKKVLVK